METTPSQGANQIHHQQQGEGGLETSASGRLATDDAGQQDHHRNEQIAALAHLFPPVGNVGGIQPSQIDARGLEVNRAGQTGEVQKGRDQRINHQVDIGHADDLGHDEHPGPQDRRYDLAAAGRHGFHGAGKNRRKTGADHQRDGKGARAHHIGHSAA